MSVGPENITSEKVDETRIEEKPQLTSISSEPKEPEHEVNSLSRRDLLNLPMPMGREYKNTALERHESFQRHKEKLRVFAEAQFMWKKNINVDSEDFAKMNVNVSEESIEIVRNATNGIK